MLNKNIMVLLYLKNLFRIIYIIFIYSDVFILFSGNYHHELKFWMRERSQVYFIFDAFHDALTNDIFSVT